MAMISRKQKWGVFGLAFLTFSVVAATVSINAGAFPYTQVPSATGVGVSSHSEVRIAALYGLAGMYRTTHGPASLGVGSTIKVTWDDGSSEEGKVSCLTSTVCVVPVPGTQKPAGSTGSGSGDSSGGGSKGGSGGGSNPGSGSGCYGNCNGEVIVGPISNAA